MPKKTIAKINVGLGVHEPDEVVYLVCLSETDNPSYFQDNVETECAECGEAIVHRPAVPENSTKICRRCADIVTKIDAAKGIETAHYVTPQTLKEINEYLSQFGEQIEPEIKN